MNNRIVRNLSAGAATEAQRRRLSTSIILAGAIDPAGGASGAGMISAVSAITLGEALGWDGWVDSEMIDQVVAMGQAAGKTGIKARFAHPGLCDDAIGRTLGRLTNWRREGDKALADLHFFKSAHKTPEGDLAAYVMETAAEEPTFFGASIEFSSDSQAEYDFYQEHLDAQKRFVSPDPKNTQNLPHWRLGELIAVAVVDSPAANPDGLFSATGGNATAAAGEALVGYALGLTEEKPKALAGMPDPERVRAFVAGYLKRHDLSVTVAKAADDAANDDGNDGQAEQIAALHEYEVRLAQLERLTKSLAAAIDTLNRRMSA